MASIDSTKRTGEASWFASRSRIASASRGYGAASVLPNTGRSGDATAIPASTSRKGPTEPDTTLEWKAVATGRRRKRSFASESLASMASMASVGPLSTTCVGPLSLASTTWLASTTPSFHSASFARTTSADAETAVIAPGVDAASAISSPRRRATRRASSRESTPAAWSAMISPKLWPATALGVTPSASRSARCERLVAPIAGCAHSVAVSFAPCASRVSASNAVFGNTTWCSGSAKTSRLAAASQGARASSHVMATEAPMSTYWLP